MHAPEGRGKGGKAPMQDQPNDLAIPAKVTISGETVFGIVAALMAVDEFYCVDMARSETEGIQLLSNTICDLYRSAFGEMYRNCEFGEPSGCRCPVCDGVRGVAEMPLYLLAEKRGDDIHGQWLAACV